MIHRAQSENTMLEYLNIPGYAKTYFCDSNALKFWNINLTNQD